MVRVICTAGSGALEYTHAFISAYTADHLRGAVAQRLSVGAYELLSNALNFGSVSSDIVLELIEADALVANLAALIDAINRAKPAGAKGQYLKGLTIANTMGPGIRVDLPAVLAAAVA